MSTAPSSNGSETKTGLKIDRVFSDPTVHPFDQITWTKRTAEIKDESGKHVFLQKDVEFPESWSQLAVNVVSSKYFYGDVQNGNGSPEIGKREYSVKQMVRRVAHTIATWGHKDGYFASTDDVKAFEDELTWLLVNQHSAFNSPVWFNCGIHAQYGVKGNTTAWRWDKEQEKVVPLQPGEAYRYPQMSACFIQSVEDNMDSIMNLAKSEAMLFKAGSGTGTDLSSLRSTKEKLSGGGKPSGPVSFFRVYDTIASIVKSGGVTRRAARMQTLHCEHPDVLEFIECKGKEDRKARALMAAGYSAGMTGNMDEAYSSVSFQNTNISIRVTDEFMRKATGEDPDPFYWTKAVVDGKPVEKLNAKDVLRKIAEETWACGDPGIQFTDTINRWHTVPNSGAINSSNPCAEFVHLDDSSCNLASLNLIKFLNDDGSFDNKRFEAAARIFIIAQEIIVDRASYPTEKIAQITHDHRPLGLGFSNLGALLMTSGLPYDSDEGRSFAGAVSALMQASAARTSAELAGVVGPFNGFAKNESPAMNVMAMHRDAAEQGYSESRKVDGLSRTVVDVWKAARRAWDDAFIGLIVHGYRNAQLSVTAPTGCATPDTLVLTSQGLRRLGRLGDVNGPQWQDVDFKVTTPDGPQKATKFYVNGKSKVVSITTKRGYSFRATHKHRIKVVDSDCNWVWRRMSEIEPGDIVPIQLGGMIGDPIAVRLSALPKLDPRATPIHVPESMTPELAELIGAFMANGSSHVKGLRISVFGGDHELIGRTARMFNNLFGLEASVDKSSKGDNCVSVSVNSTPLRRWWVDNGFAKLKPSEDHVGKGFKAHVPDAILESNDRRVYAAFIRGFIDHDGTVCGGLPEFQNTSKQAVVDMMTMALALGFPMRLRKNKCGMSGSDLWHAVLVNLAFTPRWMSLVGFTEDRKRNSVGHSSQSGRNDRIYIPSELFDEVCPIHHKSRNACLMMTGKSTATLAKHTGVRVLSRSLAQELYRETQNSKLLHYLGFFYDKVNATEESANEVETFDLSVPANVTWTGGGFVSHNTISFLMGCATTGIEPDIALVKYKKLSGGGALKYVNHEVRRALKTLGYEGESIAVVDGDPDHGNLTDNNAEDMVKWIEEKGSLEGYPLIDPKHLPVFDCAFPVKDGGRCVHWSGHVKMLAATQPFISGSQSKSINKPKDATVQDIIDAYVLCWKLGVKSAAIYRDGSKGVQPLNTKKDDKSDTKPAPQPVPVLPQRKRLPETRQAVVHKFEIQGHEGYVTVGLYPDGTPGELFVTIAKEGSTISGLLDSWATCVSIALQYGVPLDVLVNKFVHSRYEPSGFTQNKSIRIASSLTDYIVRWLSLIFSPQINEESSVPIRMEDFVAKLPEERQEAIKKRTAELVQEVKARVNTDAPSCPNCGSIMQRAGTCHTCTQCGTSSGCAG